MSQLYVVIKLKEDAVLATVQTGLRNAGFDQKLANLEDLELEGTIDSNQASNLLTVPHIDAIHTLRETE